jgi:ribosomal protein S18 acetylase RimI-like enzyme|tara:strand:- start:704 stop:1183 length:480 start_codon:yes stop_codon:yes gene_type:complete
MSVSLISELIIRAARPEDDIRCGQIVAAAWMSSEVPDQLPHALNMFDDGAPLPSDDRHRLIAEMPNFVAGFADLHLAQRHVWYLFVEPDLQGNGIGGALLDAAQEIMGGTITLQCLAAGWRSLNWYRAHGFQTVGTFRRPLCGQDVGWVRLKRVRRRNR